MYYLQNEAAFTHLLNTSSVLGESVLMGSFCPHSFRVRDPLAMKRVAIAGKRGDFRPLHWAVQSGLSRAWDWDRNSGGLALSLSVGLPGLRRSFHPVGGSFLLGQTDYFLEHTAGNGRPTALEFSSFQFR